jgi:hypothetical protein
MRGGTMNPDDYDAIALGMVKHGMGPYAVAEHLNTACHIDYKSALDIAFKAHLIHTDPKNGEQP